MISIPLNLKNEIENVIKMKFFEKIIIISNNFTNNYFITFGLIILQDYFNKIVQEKQKINFSFRIPKGILL